MKRGPKTDSQQYLPGGSKTGLQQHYKTENITQKTELTASSSRRQQARRGNGVVDGGLLES